MNNGKAWLWGAVMLSLAGCRSAAEPPPPDVFEPWDGVWQGNFRVLQGDEVVTELRVTQRYWSERPGLQHGRFREVDVETQKVVTATAVNERLRDGLRCTVVKSTGERVVHRGRWTGKAIEWFRETQNVTEFFRESIVSKDGETYYEIRGWGRYDGGPRLDFEGRYRKVGTERQARPP